MAFCIALLDSGTGSICLFIALLDYYDDEAKFGMDYKHFNLLYN